MNRSQTLVVRAPFALNGNHNQTVVRQPGSGFQQNQNAGPPLSRRREGEIYRDPAFEISSGG